MTSKKLTIEVTSSQLILRKLPVQTSHRLSLWYPDGHMHLVTEAYRRFNWRQVRLAKQSPLFLWQSKLSSPSIKLTEEKQSNHNKFYFAIEMIATYTIYTCLHKWDLLDVWISVSEVQVWDYEDVQMSSRVWNYCSQKHLIITSTPIKIQGTMTSIAMNAILLCNTEFNKYLPYTHKL